MKKRKGVLTAAILGLIGLGLGAAAISPAVRRAWTLHPKTGKPLLTPGQDGDATLLFNGWRLRPAGRPIATGDMLMGGAFSPDGTLLAIANSGWNGHALHIVDVTSEKEIAKLSLGRSWNGLAWSPDGQKIYVAGGISNTINDVHVIARNGAGEWEKQKGFKLTSNDPKRTAIAGLALSQDGKNLFVCNNSDDYVYVVDTETGATRNRIQVGDHPIASRLSKDGETLYVADLGSAQVSLVDVRDPLHPQVSGNLKTGEHPNDLALSTDGRLFVTCGNANVVSVFDTKTRQPLETIRTAMTPKAPAGSTPVALAVSPDNHALYIANADNNDICVVDVSARGTSHVRGFIPTGWYPSAVLVTPDGKRIIVGSGKGSGSKPNPAKTPINPGFPTGFDYIARQLNGSLAFVDVPTAAQLASYTQQVYQNTPYRDSQLTQLRSGQKTAIPTRVGDSSPIKYVLYIIKENRTYDQVFGDMPQGNGDPNLTLFGRDVTPNHHALAEQFILLDNLYCNGEVSADGHPWSTSAITTDFTQRSWLLSYSAKGDTVESDSVGVPTNGYIWDACKRKGLSYRSYGEYVYATSAEAAPEQKVEGATGLKGHGSPRYVGIGWPKDKPMRDMDKADIFIEEFKEFERTKTMPRFMIMSLGEDHTSGTTAGTFTPKACVASNDQAIGRMVETISHSSVWKEFAIFIIEDDAQNGPDHVDSHRTMGLVISPYTRRGYVDSTMYTTASLLHTMELILGLPPMTQYDAAATPMFASFTDRADLTPYTCVGPRIDLAAKNQRGAFGASASAKMDFTAYDRIDEDTLNQILWHSIKGKDVPMPSPVRSALVMNGRIQPIRTTTDD